MRLRVGVIGGGSVGSGVAEILSRIGVGELYVMDYDFVKKHNLDRLLHATQKDAEKRVNKAKLLCKRITESATTKDFKCTPYDKTSVVEEEGYRLVLDCDVLFSCVDRPWPRQVLNHIAYTCLEPVVDGGVSFKLREDHRLIHGMFRAQTVGPERACLNCLGGYDPGLVQQDREGSLEDPAYIEQLRRVGKELQHENIMSFSLGLAALEMIPIPIPGMLGIYETSLTATLITLGVPGAISASAMILLRLVTSVFDIPATGYAAYRYRYQVLMKNLPGSA